MTTTHEQADLRQQSSTSYEYECSCGHKVKVKSAYHNDNVKARAERALAQHVRTAGLTCDVHSSDERCPGYGVHCRDGKHCTSTDVTCALDASHEDHWNECCFCKSAVY